VVGVRKVLRAGVKDAEIGEVKRAEQLAEEERAWAGGLEEIHAEGGAGDADGDAGEAGPGAKIKCMEVG
jgi:hypothetical protein